MTSSPVAAALQNMQEGLWEITTKVEISALPEGLPEHTVQQCVTKKNLEEGKGKMHQLDSRNNKCAVKDYKVEGNKASWSIACSGVEWLHRQCSESHRLWKRHLVTNTLFILGATRQMLFGGGKDR